jgi:hypothetical protein
MKIHCSGSMLQKIMSVNSFCFFMQIHLSETSFAVRHNAETGEMALFSVLFYIWCEILVCRTACLSKSSVIRCLSG